METFDALAKLVVIGDSSVGKTCLILRYTQDIFRENFLPTIGVDFKTKVVEVGSKRYKLQLWDTAGQERYDSLRRGFYRGAKGVVIVYDITKIQSFDNVTKWIDDMHSSTGPTQPLILILGNKCDLESQRKISKGTALQLAHNAGASFGEVSAKTGDGIEETFKAYIQKLSEHIDKEQVRIQELGGIGHSVDISEDWISQTDNGYKCCGGGAMTSTSPNKPNNKLEFNVLI